MELDGVADQRHVKHQRALPRRHATTPTRQVDETKVTDEVLALRSLASTGATCVVGWLVISLLVGRWNQT